MANAPPPLPPSRGKRLVFWGLLAAFLAAFAWTASVVGRATAGYVYVKSKPQGWRGRVVRADPRLGVAPVPGAVGAEITKGGFDTPVRFDDEGFRIPVRGDEAGGEPTVMALGCSFTFGSGVEAEEAYPWRVARGLGGRVLNAGHPGYGLAQMLPLARELLPRHRPDVLLVQASTWLPARASRPLRSSRFDLFPVPYFEVGQGGIPVWRPPRFLGRAFDLPITRYRDTPSGLADWASFVARVGVPLFVHDDPHRVADLVRHAAGRLPETASLERISAFVYPEILRLCREQGTRMVVVVLEGPGKHIFATADLALPPRVLVVDTKPKLYAPLSAGDAGAYLRAYGHWRGDPPRLIDEHPNARAHAIIAEQVLDALSR